MCHFDLSSLLPEPNGCPAGHDSLPFRRLSPGPCATCRRLWRCNPRAANVFTTWSPWQSMTSTSSSSLSPSSVGAASPESGRSYGPGPPMRLEPPSTEDSALRGQLRSLPLCPSRPRLRRFNGCEYFATSLQQRPPHRGCQRAPPLSLLHPKLPPPRSSASTTLNQGRPSRCRPPPRPLELPLPWLSASTPKRARLHLQRLSTPSERGQWRFY